MIKNINKNNPNINPDLYIKVKEKTVIFYSKTTSLSDEEIEQFMVDTIPYDYTELYS